jgi:lysophospholipase L1-like esterase
MQKRGLKAILFRVILVLILVSSFEIIGYIGIWINSRSFDFLSNRSYFHIRAMLMGNQDPKMLPRYLTLPHLGYVPYPGYQKYGVIQHNEDGYRGERVPREKGSKYRILCLGGSTTYGFGVDSPWKAYPSQIERLLNTYIVNDSVLKKKYTGVEVINAGIDGGTSAEELQQYLFKYRYYHPDVVIVNSGVNDALLYSGNDPDFQFDYTDTRRINFHLEPMAQPGRFLLHSYFISFITIRLFYNNFAQNGGRDEFMHNGNQKFIKWSGVNLDTIIEQKKFEYYPFYKNSKSLYGEIIQDSSLLIILPNFLNYNSDFVKSSQRYAAASVLNLSLSRSLCNELKGTYIPLEFGSISDTSFWVGDDCHLNAKGEKAKAEFILPYLKNIVNRSIKQ